MNDAKFIPAEGQLCFTAEEVRAMTGLSDVTLWRLAQRGLLVPVRHVRHRIYARAELERFLNGKARP